MDYIGTIITVVVGIFVATINTIIGINLNRREKANSKYREEREQKEKEERARKETDEEYRRIALLSMLRATLYSNYDQVKMKGWYSTHDREVYHDLWMNYKQLGGNGVMDDIQKEIVKFPRSPQGKPEE